MKCFNHHDRDAVGVCRACSKGLCPECATDLDIAIACRSKHEDQARRLSMVQVRASRVGSILPFFLIGVGLLFVCWGVLTQPISVFTTLVGAAFLLLGIVFLVSRRNFIENVEGPVKAPHRTNRWTRAAGARFVNRSVRRQVL